MPRLINPIAVQVAQATPVQVEVSQAEMNKATAAESVVRFSAVVAASEHAAGSSGLQVVSQHVAGLPGLQPVAGLHTGGLQGVSQQFAGLSGLQPVAGLHARSLSGPQGGASQQVARLQGFSLQQHAGGQSGLPEILVSPFRPLPLPFSSCPRQ